MTIAEKLLEIDKNTDEVIALNNDLESALNGGTIPEKSQYDEFWDSYQDGEIWMPYLFASVGWKDTNFKPKRDIKPVGAAQGLFRFTRIQNLKKCLEDCGVVLDTSKATNTTYMFADSDSLRVLPKIDFSSATTTDTTFYNSRFIESIEELVVSPTTKFASNCFSLCTALTHLIMTNATEMSVGDLSSDLNLQRCIKLDKASVTSIIDSASTTTSGLTVTFSKTAVNKAFETSEGANDGAESPEWTALKNKKTNWTISLI